jgi:cytochrome c553
MNRIVRRLILAMPMVLGSATALGQGSPWAVPLEPKERAALFPSAAEIERGRGVAASSCAGCHGLDGFSVDENLPHLAGQRTIYLYRDLLAYKQGTRTDDSMRHAVEFLSDEALLNVSAYYADLVLPSSGPAAASDTAEDDPLQAGRVATAGCAGCHGADGNSSVPGMPNLTAQHPDYFATAMRAYQAGTRPDALMKSFTASLDEDTIASMALYYALQEPQPAAGRGSGDPEAGSALAEPCAGCHGADGNAAAAENPTLAGQDAMYLAKTMREYRDGQRDHALMVSAMAGLQDSDIEDVAAFYAEQEPAARGVPRPLTTAEWVARCNRCHGIRGNSTDPRYPSLAGQHQNYLVRVLEAYVSGERNNAAMHAMAMPLRGDVIERLAAYYAAQQAKSVVYVALPATEADEN